MTVLGHNLRDFGWNRLLNGPTLVAHGHLFSLCRIVVLAGDTLPIDVYCHLPVMCEDKNLPYAYIPSKVVSLPP